MALLGDAPRPGPGEWLCHTPGIAPAQCHQGWLCLSAGRRGHSSCSAAGCPVLGWAVPQEVPAPGSQAEINPPHILSLGLQTSQSPSCHPAVTRASCSALFRALDPPSWAGCGTAVPSCSQSPAHLLSARSDPFLVALLERERDTTTLGAATEALGKAVPWQRAAGEDNPFSKHVHISQDT